MNQWIEIEYEIEYELDWQFDLNYWDICFKLNKKVHREKAPSGLDSGGDWDWYIKGVYQIYGIDFSWNKK